MSSVDYDSDAENEDVCRICKRSGDAQTQSTNDEAVLQEQPRVGDVDEEERNDLSYWEKTKLVPLFICSVIGSIVATRYIWHTVKPTKDTAGHNMEPYIFAFKWFGDNRVPMFPKIEKEKKKKKE